MKTDDIGKLFDRISRFQKRLGIKDGLGFSWDCTLDNGETQHYAVKGIKPPEEIEDDVENAFIWLWSLKDSLQKSEMKEKDWIEKRVNSNSYLSICADLANGLKHRGLDRSRSGKWPKLGKVQYQIPQAAIGEIAFGAFDVKSDIKNAQLVKLKMPILDKKGDFIGDAFEYIGQCMNAWQAIMDDVKKDRQNKKI